MRERGQDVPDPQPGQPIRLDHGDNEPPAGWDEALTACRHLLPNQAVRQGPTAQELEQLRAFAVCMREHDIAMSDPITEGERVGNMKIRGRLEFVTREQLDADPGYQAAYAACKAKLPDGGEVNK